MSKPRANKPTPHPGGALICDGSHDKHCPHLSRHCHVHLPTDYESYDPCGERKCMVMLASGAIGRYERRTRCVPAVYLDGLWKPSRPAIVCNE